MTERKVIKQARMLRVIDATRLGGLAFRSAE